jgi:hypothetical protein
MSIKSILMFQRIKQFKFKKDFNFSDLLLLKLEFLFWNFFFHIELL